MKIDEFKQIIWDYYKKNKRDLLWRNTHDPYHILVSEIMLQQTQVARVLVKYPQFIAAFPTIKHLATAPFKRVLAHWQGLGYNRRALYLYTAAKIVMKKYNGTVPNKLKILISLPGIGKGTAGAVSAFAFNKPEIFIETNIRRVFIHFFFQNEKDINDKSIHSYIEKTVDQENPRDWYYALMDYGAMLGRAVENPNRKSKHYLKQTTFEGSNRQVRGMIVKLLLKKGHNKTDLEQIIHDPRLKSNIDQLIEEGFVKEHKKNFYTLNSSII